MSERPMSSGYGPVLPWRSTVPLVDTYPSARRRPVLHTFHVRIEGTAQALTSEGCTVCDDIPGLTDHGQGD